MLLWHYFDASSHTLRRRLTPSTNSAAYNQVLLTCRGPSQLSVLHLELESFTARIGARYWPRIAIFTYLNQLHSTPPLRGSVLPWRLVC